MIIFLIINNNNNNMDFPINNFKGVMLCNRPNENVMKPKDKFEFKFR